MLSAEECRCGPGGEPKPHRVWGLGLKSPKLGTGGREVLQLRGVVGFWAPYALGLGVYGFNQGFRTEGAAGLSS